MTDYFALLDQPRRPWLEEDELKTRYHAKTLQLHPDAQPETTGSAGFAELNDAYRTLRDPKLRLRHLLDLHGSADRANNTVPDSLQTLFPQISAATHRADLVLEKFRSATTALTRGLLKPELLRPTDEVDRLLAAIRKLHDQALAEMRTLDDKWGADPTHDRKVAQRLVLTFTYLGRWIAQLEEKRFQLSSA